MSKISNQGKPFFMMFDVLEGGIVEPIEFNRENLTPDRSIIVMDEDTQTVWLWHGKRRALVPRRTALRQAQSLKGHGYQAGNAIVGRDLKRIVEIDDRKVGREPETTELNDAFTQVLNRTYGPIANFVFVETAGAPPSAPKAKETPALAATPPIVESDGPEYRPKLAPKPEAPATPVKSTIQVEERPVLKHVPISEVKEPVKPKDPVIEPPQSGSTAQKAASPVPLVKMSDELLKGALVMSVLKEFRDLWISSKDNGHLSLEHMDGKICSFTVEEGKLKYMTGAFAEVPGDIRASIEAKFDELTK